MSRRFAVLPLAWLALAPALVAGTAHADDAAAARAAAEDVVRANVLAQRRLELAQGDAFYLVIDPDGKRLQLMLKNAVLRDFDLLGLEIGEPSVAWASRGLEGEWQGRVFAGGELDPARPLDRMVIVAPPPTREGTEVELPVPPTPEEKYPVPSRYHVRFEGRVSLEVRTNEADPEQGIFSRLTTGLAHWWHDARSAMGADEADLLRLRLVLAPEDAKSLYRAMPPAVRLIVIPVSTAPS